MPSEPTRPRPFAQGTRLSVEKSKADISKLLARHGCTGIDWFEAGSLGRAGVEFTVPQINARVRVVIPLPRPEDYPVVLRPARGEPTPHEQETMRRWRTFVAYVKVRLVAIEDHLREWLDEFEEELVMQDGRTWAEHQRPALQRALQAGELKALPAPGDTVR